MAKKKSENATKNIPDFSNVCEGQVWTGGRRVAKFIRELGFEPKPASSNSRDAQMKHIRCYCSYIDDTERKVLVLTEIYQKARPKERKEKEKKYEEHIAYLLLNRLQDVTQPTLKTTKGHLLVDIGAISPFYKKRNDDFYKNMLKKYGADFMYSHRIWEYFIDIANERMKEIVAPVLQNLEHKGYIKCESYYVAVRKNKDGTKSYFPVISNNGAKNVLLENKILESIHWACKQIKVNASNDYSEYSVVNLKNINDVMKLHRNKEFCKYQNQYLEEKYNFSNVFTQIKISLKDEYSYSLNAIGDKRETPKVLNELVVNAVLNTIYQKYENKEKDFERKLEKAFQIYLETGNTVIKGVKLFKYPEALVYLTPHFVDCELSLDATKAMLSA